MESEPQPTQPETAASELPSVASKVAGDYFDVLIVDDNLIDRELDREQLKSAWPFEVPFAADFAANGEEAIEKISRRPFVLVLLDWSLPRANGGQVLRSIRQAGYRTPVVVVSSMNQEAIGENLERLGAAFLNKNKMNTESLREAILSSLRLLQNRPVL
jgi:CheY-like chemotaxis protein